MKRPTVFIMPAMLLGMVLLLQTGCAVDGGGYYRYQRDWYPYGRYYWWPYEAYPERYYRYRYVPRQRKHRGNHYIGRPRFNPPHERRERHETREPRERSKTHDALQRLQRLEERQLKKYQ